VLALVAVPLAAPGEVVVPAASGMPQGGPRWLFGIYGHGLGIPGPAYYFCLWAALGASVVVARSAAALGPRVVWAAIATGLIVFALAPPLLSQDAFSYISYARMAHLHGANPYETAPVAYPGDAAFPYVGWRFAVSAYGPLFSIATRPLALVGVPAAFWSLKALGAASVGAVAAMTAAVAKRRGVEPLAAAALVALNPLVLVHVVGGPHNDALMMVLVMAAVLAMLSRREAAAGASFALAGAMKISGAVAGPFAALASRRWSFLAGFGLALAAVLAVTIPVYGTAALDSISLLGDNQDLTTRLSLPRIASNVPLVTVAAARVAALLAYAALVVWLARWTWRGGDWVRAAGWATLGLLLATSWIVPWYLLWVLPLAAVAEDRALLAGTLALCGLQLAYGVPW
jgi:alpha-1,6-mannosyltransferase